MQQQCYERYICETNWSRNKHTKHTVHLILNLLKIQGNRLDKSGCMFISHIENNKYLYTGVNFQFSWKFPNSMKKYIPQYVLRWNVRKAKITANCPTARKSYGEMTHGEMFLRRTVLMAKCPTAKSPTAKNPTAKCPVTRTDANIDTVLYIRWHRCHHRHSAVYMVTHVPP